MAAEDWIHDDEEWWVYHEPRCNRCGRPIWWSKRGAKWIPMSGDGDEHLSVCSARRAKASEFPDLEG